MTVWAWTAICAGEVLTGRRLHNGNWTEVADMVAADVRLAACRGAHVSVTVRPVEVPYGDR